MRAAGSWARTRVIASMPSITGIERSMSVTLENSHAGLTIADDGRGFSAADAEAAREDGHLGLRVLGDMARGAGGSLDIDSEPGRGTRVCLEVPVA